MSCIKSLVSANDVKTPQCVARISECNQGLIAFFRIIFKKEVLVLLKGTHIFHGAVYSLAILRISIY